MPFSGIVKNCFLQIIGAKLCLTSVMSVWSNLNIAELWKFIWNFINFFGMLIKQKIIILMEKIWLRPDLVWIED